MIFLLKLSIVNDLTELLLTWLSTSDICCKSGLILPLFVDDGSALNVSTRNCFKSL